MVTIEKKGKKILGEKDRGIDRGRSIKSSPGENKLQGLDNLKTIAADTRLGMRGGCNIPDAANEEV